MVNVRVVNPFSGRFELIGQISESDWRSGSFWVPIEIRGAEGMVARRDLREC